MFKEVYYTTVIFILQAWFMPATNSIIRDSISDNVDIVCPPLFDDSIKNVFRNRIVACSFDSKNCSFQNNGYIQSIDIPDANHLNNSFNSSNGIGYLYGYGGQLVLNVNKTLYTDIKNFDIYITIAYYSEDGKYFGASVTGSEGHSFNSSYTNVEYLVLYDWYVLNARYIVTESDYIMYFSGSNIFSKVDDVCVFQVCKNGYTFNETSDQCEVAEATMISDPSSEGTSTVQNLNTSEYTPLPFVSITTTKSTTVDNIKSTTTESTTSEYTTAGFESTTTGLESTAYGFESTTTASESSTYGFESKTTASESSTYGFESTTTGSESTTYGFDSTTTASESNTYGFESTTTASESTTYGFESTTTATESTIAGLESTTTDLESSTNGNGPTTTASESTTHGIESTTTAMESTTKVFESTNTASESTTYGIESTTTASESTTYGIESTTTSSESTTYGIESTTASESTTKVFESTTTVSESTAIPTEATVVSNKSSSVSYESTVLNSDFTTAATITTDSTTTVPKSEKRYTEYKSEASNFTDTSTDSISVIPGSSSPTIESATNQTTPTQATTNQPPTNQTTETQITTTQVAASQMATTTTTTTQYTSNQDTTTQATTTQATTNQTTTTKALPTLDITTQPPTNQTTATQITTTQVAASQTAKTTTPIVLTSTSFVIVIPSNLTSNGLMKTFYIILVKLLSGSLPTRNPDSYSWDEISNHTDGMYLVGVLNATKGITTFTVGAGSNRKRRDSVPAPANPPLEKGVAYSTFVKGVTVDDITVTTPYSVIVKIPNVSYITTTSPLAEVTMISNPPSKGSSTVQNINTPEYTPLTFVSITTTKSTTIDNTKSTTAKSTSSEYITADLESTTAGLESTTYGFKSTTTPSESATYGFDSTTTASESTTYGFDSTTTASDPTTYGFECTTASESTTKVFESTITASKSTAIPTEATVVSNKSSSVSYESTVLNSDFTTAATITTDFTTTVPKSENIYTEYKSEASNFTDTSTDSISAIPGSSSPTNESATNQTTTTQTTTNQPPTNQTTETQITTTQVAASQTATTTTPIVLTSTSFVIVIPSNLTSNNLMKTFYIILVKLLSGSLPTRNSDSYSWDEISNHTDGMYLVGILNATKGVTMFTVGAGSSRKRRDSVPVSANPSLEKGVAYSTFIKGVTVDDITVTTPYSDIVKIPNVSYITTTTPLAKVTMISNPPSESSSTVQNLNTSEYTPLPFVSIATTESTTVDNTKSTTAKSTSSEYTTAGLEYTTTGLESSTYGFKSTTTPSESATYGFDSTTTASESTTYGFDSTTTASDPTTYGFECTTASESTTKVFESTITASKSTAIPTEATVVYNKSSYVSSESTVLNSDFTTAATITTDSTTTVPKSEKIYTEYKSEASNFTDTSTYSISAIPGSSSPTIESATSQITTTQATTNQATTNQATTNQATTAQATKNQATTTQTKTTQGTATQGIATQGTATQAVTTRAKTTQASTTQALTTQGTVNQGTATQAVTTQATTTQVAAFQTATTTTPIVLTSTSFVIVIPSNLTSNSSMKSFYIILVKLLSGSLPTRYPDSYSWDEISNHTDGMYLVGILNATKGITTFIVGAGSSRKRRDSVPVPANPPLEKGVAYSTFIKGVTVDDITVTTPYSVIVKVPNVSYITTTSPLNLCGSSKCSSYADCVVQNSLPVCICRQGFICEDKCITQGLCSNNAKCYIVDGHETCKCDQGYLGDGLSAPGSYGCKDPCTTVSCGSYGYCTVENSLPVCKCRAGFVCTDQCISQGLCSTNAKCLVVEGHETCKCDQGYIGDGLNAPGSVGCQSPCAKVQCGPYADCIVENNFPDCKCRAGFICGGNCTTQGLCSSNAKCSIVDGHETCICGQGFAGDGLSKPGSIGCKDAHYLELINLDSIIVTKSNVEVAAFNLSQIVQKGNLTARNLELITNIISKVVNANSSSESVINDVLTSVDTVLSLSIDLVSANKNLNLFANFISDLDALGKQLTNNVTISRKNLALASYSIERNQNPIFIYSMLNGANISLHISSNDMINVSKNLNAYIFLPSQLFDERNETQIYSYVFLEKVFFENSSSIDSVVLSATINDVIVKNSIYPISMMFLRDTSTRGKRACNFYKIPENVWSTEGCNTTSNSSKEVLCQCNHLTNFALILDVDQSGNNPLALRIMTWIGCGISIAGLFFTILTYCLFQKLRVNVPSQILLNLCISLLITLVLFLALVEHTQPRILCQTVASLLQFFILSTFTWMLIKGINLYQLFVKVLRSAHNSRVFMVKSYAFAWGIPLIITVATSTIKPGNLGPGTDNDPKICVVRGLSFYCGILLPICVIMLANVVLLVLVLRGIDSKSKSINKTHIKINVRIALGCSLLLGTTWIFAILAVGDLRDVFQWLFCIFNSLQGFFIFLFYVVRNSDVKNQWRLFLGKKNLIKSSIQNGSQHMNTNSTSF